MLERGALLLLLALGIIAIVLGVEYRSVAHCADTSAASVEKVFAPCMASRGAGPGPG
jgi:hypothetical protein